MDLIILVGDMDMVLDTDPCTDQDIGLIDMGMDPDTGIWEGMDMMIGITNILSLSMSA
jgi:hypothetical protein